MNAFQFQLYRFSFWLAPTTALSLWQGATKALAQPEQGLWMWWPLVVIYGIVPLLDLLCGKVVTRFSAAEQRRLINDPMLRVIPWICALLWLATLA